MTQESLSALLDGECSAEELDRLLDDMERWPALKQAYSRQCLVREAGEGVSIRKEQACICAGVMSRLGEMDAAPSAKVTDLDSRRRWLNWKPLAGLAAAASVAALAILVVPATQDSGADPLMNIEAGADLAPAAIPVKIPAARPSRNLQSVAYTPDEQAQVDELNSLLMEHSNSLAGQGMGGTMRYARFAAHNAVYTPAAAEQP